MLSSGQDEPVTLNKSELARKLKVSLPTLTAWLNRWPDFPVVERGTNGSSYKFDPAAVFQFLEQRKIEELERKEAQDQKLTSLQLQFDEILAPQRDVPSTYESRLPLKDQKLLWEIREKKRKELERCKKLVNAEELQDVLNDVFARLGQETRTFCSRFLRDQGFPDAIVRKFESDLAAVQRTVVGTVITELQASETEERSTSHELQSDLIV